jgi:hypothetical protein
MHQNALHAMASDFAQERKFNMPQAMKLSNSIGLPRRRCCHARSDTTEDLFIIGIGNHGKMVTQSGGGGKGQCFMCGCFALKGRA